MRRVRWSAWKKRAPAALIAGLLLVAGCGVGEAGEPAGSSSPHMPVPPSGSPAPGIPMQNTAPDHPHTLPVVSIHTDPELLWSWDKGIYAAGPGAGLKYPYYGANYWKDTSIPVRFEYREPADSEPKVSARGEAKIFGGVTRTLPQKALALRFKEEPVRYPLFEGLKVAAFESLVLRNSGQDFDKTHFLDGLASNLMQGTEVDVQAYRPVVIYLAGRYWGVQDLREKIDVDFLAAHHGVTASDIDLLETDADVKAGSDNSYRELIKYMIDHDLREDAVYQKVSKLMDLNSFTDYLIGEMFIANTDWPGHNIRYWRSTDGRVPWRWILYDADQTFGDPQDRTLERVLQYDKKSKESLRAPYLLQMLLDNASYRRFFLQRFAERLNGAFSASRVLAEIDKIHDRLASEMPYHQQKWGGSMEKWESDVEALRQFARQRPAALKRQLQEAFELTDNQMKEYGF